MLIPSEPTSGGGYVCAEHEDILLELEARFQPAAHCAGVDSLKSKPVAPLKTLNNIL